MNMIADPIAQFWASGKDLKEEGVFNASLKRLLTDVRKTLPDTDPLAKSIDRRDRSNVMAKIAVEKDLIELGEILLLDLKLRI